MIVRKVPSISVRYLYSTLANAWLFLDFHCDMLGVCLECRCSSIFILHGSFTSMNEGVRGEVEGEVAMKHQALDCKAMRR